MCSGWVWPHILQFDRLIVKSWSCKSNFAIKGQTSITCLNFLNLTTKIWLKFVWFEKAFLNSTIYQLHYNKELELPWNFISIAGTLYVFAEGCREKSPAKGGDIKLNLFQRGTQSHTIMGGILKIAKSCALMTHFCSCGSYDTVDLCIWLEISIFLRLSKLQFWLEFLHKYSMRTNSLSQFAERKDKIGDEMGKEIYLLDLQKLNLRQFQFGLIVEAHWNIELDFVAELGGLMSTRPAH